jgi:uncharacterized protein (TIGR00255 family)
MTGFGTSTHAGVVCEARSVNSRSLDVRLRAPLELGDASLWAEQLTKKRLRRGRVELSIRIEASGTPAPLFQRAKAVAALQAFADVARELGYPERPPLTVLASVPGLFDAGSDERAALRGSAEQALEAALDELDRDRAREGATLKEELLGRAASVQTTLARVSERAGVLPQQFRARLKARLAKQQASEQAQVDDARIEQEVALLADRCDVAEELSRLGSHTAHFCQLCSAAEVDGRRLDFLLQEMMREATTLAAKAQDAEVSRDVVDIKVDLDRMREQVQNVE